MNRLVLLALAIALGPLVRAAAAEEPSDRQVALEERAARDPEGLVSATRRLLDADLSDAAALDALLLGAAATRRADLLDDAIEVARPRAGRPGSTGSTAFGSALLARARLETPPDRERLAEAERLLAPAETAGTHRAALDLAYARHLLGDVDGARRAYERAFVVGSPPFVETREAGIEEKAVAGLESLAGGAAEAFDPETEGLLARHPLNATVARRRADAVARGRGPAEAAAFLEAWRAGYLAKARVPSGSHRVMVDLARHLRAAGRLDEALDAERRVLESEGAPLDLFVVRAVWGAFRQRRLATFEDCDRLERDARRLLERAGDDPHTQVGVRNDVAFLFREVVSGFTWRGEARTQGIAEGAPPQVRALLDRCVALYDEAVARIPKDVADRSFPERWLYAGVCNDTGLMRHYFTDVRDLAKAEALYHRAFELTDGAYMDAYYYNLQYLYGFELPGREETWFRLARRASERILRETEDGGLEPDERKREAARRDAEGLKALLAARDAVR